MEIFDRELGGGILLTKKAIENGWQVVFGGKGGIFPNLSRFKDMPGVFLLKSIVPGETFIQKKILKDGHKITSLDVEGLVPSEGEAGVKLRYSKESIELSDILFFWGEKHYKSVHSIYPTIKNKSIISGSPIIDDILLKRKKRINRQQNKLNKILIATSCGYSNHISGKNYSYRMTMGAMANNLDQSEITKLQNEVLLDQIVLCFWKEFITDLAKKMPNTVIVVRPHPSEDKLFWDKYFEQYSNIIVNKTGSINDQMIDSDAFIHFNSTTAITSRIFDIPTFMIMPDIENNLHSRITYVKDFSIIINSVEQFINIYKGKPKKINTLYLKNDLSEFCINCNKVNYNSSRLIIQAFENNFKFTNYKGKIKIIELKEYLRYKKNRTRYFLFWTLGIILELIIKFNFRLLPQNIVIRIKNYHSHLPPKNSYKYSKAKQPKLKTSTIINLLNNYKALDISINKISNNLFLIKGR